MTDRYTLLSEIGRGGMGVVWKARDEETGSIVAIKLLHPAFALDPDYLARFERELSLAKRIHSANVVRVLGFGERDGAPYLAHEFVDGPSLRDLIATHGPYTWDEARPLLAQMAQGLADAHAAGVIHRDLKPSNVLVGSDGVVRIADFGIAKGVDLTRVTGTSTLLGTPAYLAPEGPLDERSDLYSLGIIGYEMLTGVAPFRGTTYQEVIVRHIREAPDLDKLPQDARPVIGWLLAKDPADRPQRAGLLLPVLWGGAGVTHRSVVAVQEQPSPVSGAVADKTVVIPRKLEPSAGQQPSVSSTPETASGLRRRGRVMAALLAVAVIVAVSAAAAFGAFAAKGPSHASPSGSDQIAAALSETPSPAPFSFGASPSVDPTQSPPATDSPAPTPTPKPTPTKKPTPKPTKKPTPKPIILRLTVAAANSSVTPAGKVSAGESVGVAASGTWCLSPTECGGPGGIWIAADPHYLQLPSAEVGALIGRIGTGPWFLLGSNASFRASSTGELELLFNELPGGYGDNSGTVSVRVTLS